MGHQINASPNDIFQIRPDTDTVEIRMITNPEHPEYDPRVELPVDEELVLDLDKRGMLQPARGYKLKKKNDAGQDVVVLTVGRQRWKAVQEVWRRRREEGRDLKSAPAFRLLITAAQSVAARRGEQIAENRHRQALEGLPLAQSLRAWLDLVGDDEAALEDARVTFNFKSIAALNNCLALLDTTPAVQAALLDGTLSPTAGLQLSRQTEEIQDKAIEVLRSEAEGGIDSENHGAEDPEDGNEGGEADDGEGGDGPAPREAPEERSTPQAKKSASVSRVKEVITNLTGGKSFQMVNMRLLEKRLEKVAVDLDKAMTKLEDCNDGTKTGDLAARVAKLQGWDEALRWARGETAASGAGSVSQGNDPMSAAWTALMDALTQAEWPRILQPYQSGRPSYELERRSEPDYEAIYREECQQADLRVRMSHVLVVAGELVAERQVASDGVTRLLYVNTATKWFTRLMDPHGSPTRLVRDWGAHGWLEPMGKRGGIPSYKSKVGYLGADWNRIQIQPKALEKAIAGTPLGTPYSVEEQVLEIIRENVEGDAWSRVSRSSRFGTPWHTDGEDEGAIGPDLRENDGVRVDIVDGCREILNDCVESCEWFNIPPEDRTWPTVGDLVDYVVRRVEEIRAQAAAPSEEPTNAPAGDDQGDEAGQDGEA